MNSIITTTASNSTLTMSSREIAKLTGKRHDHVIRDIEKMLEDVAEDAPKFGGIYMDAHGREKKCYNLPKNLTLNLITGYRADLRLKIIDRWMELETKTTIQITDSGNLNAAPKPKRPRKPPMLATFKTGYGIAKELGLDDNQAASHAGRYCLNKCGENPLPALGLDSRPTPTEANYYTVTELGKEIGLSGQAMNKLLIEQGYQVKVSGGSSSAAYEPTEKGKPHARLFDEVRKGGRGSQQALKWKHVIVSLLHPFYENTSVSAVTDSHPFGGGNAGVRMSDAEIEMYLLRVRLSLPDENGRYQVPREGRKRNILNVGKAIAQLWHDLEEEERASVKALA